jgi:uncharacterized protein
MWQRAEEAGRKFIWLHFRRMILLIIFGLLHAYLLWMGDILFLYGICGILIVALRKRKPATLIIVGILLMSVHTLINLGGGFSMQYWPAEELESFRNELWKPTPEYYQPQIEAYQGGWLKQMEARIPDVIMMHTQGFTTWGLWRASGAMLIGMALFKLGILSGKRKTRFYVVLCCLGLFIGIPIVLYGIYNFYQQNWDVSVFFLGMQYNYWGSLLVSLGWIGLVMLVFQKNWLTGLQKRFAAVGRLAFTNYLMQTFICTTIFYGHGLGLFGEVSRVGQLFVVLSVWIFQLIVSPIWLKYYRIGPFEWLWRTLSYMKVLPMKR